MKMTPFGIAVYYTRGDDDDGRSKEATADVQNIKKKKQILDQTIESLSEVNITK
jgi:hypothetical protein